MKSFKVIQRVISMLIAIALIVSTMPVVAGESSDATSGVTGECLWSFDGATLTISGNGDMADYTSVNSPPWDIYKDSIHYITIEDGVSHIGKNAFEECFEVFEVTIPGSVKSIGAGAFLCCTSLDYVNLPDGIVTIGGSAFKMCDLYSVRIPASVTNIGGGAFSLNFDFTGFTIDEENTVYSNDDYGALLNKDKTTLISVPCSVLEDRYTSNPLTEYTVPNSVTHIGYNAFYCCDELTSVTLPSSVETVASEAFTDCSSLNTVYYAGDESQRENIDFSGSNRYLVNATWYYNSCINKAEHDYTNNCDEECNTCSMKRVISHSFSDAQDTQCDVCDHTRVLESIAITSYPDKLSYTELADNLDTTGGEITLYYNDNTSGVIEITSDMVSGFDNSIVGKQLLTITYDDKTCEYEVTIIKATDYFVTFCNWDNTVISTEVYHRGDKVAIPEDPTKQSDNIYNYTFAGWDKEVVDCEGDATYTATYTAEYIDYTVTFKNWDGTVLSTKTYHYGDVVTEPATPTRAKDKVYTYTFDSWDKEIVDCVENATYTATYTAEYIDYTVTFKNWDGTVLSTKSYHYGDEVTEPDAPTKEADDTYTYIFNGWDNPVTECTGNATYTAKYKSIPNDAYTITYHLDGGTNALKNPDMYTEEDTITLMDATKVGYDFAGWFLDPEKTKKISKISNRTENLDLYAKFTPKSYTATFIDNGATKSSTLTITLDDSIGTTKKYYINNNESFSPYSYWIPKRDNYVFAGWYIGTQLVSDTIEATSDITLKAKWNLCDQYGSRENPIILGENSAAVYSNGGSYFYSEKLNYSWSEYPTEYLGYDTSDFSYNSGGWVYVYVYVSGEYQILNYEAECGERQDGTKRGYCEIYDVTKQQELVTFPPSYYDWDSYSGSFEVEPGSLLRLGVGYFMSAGYEDYWGELRISLGETRTGTISSTNQRISEQEFDSHINAPSVSKTGYKFLGWYDEQGNQITETWQYTADQTFKAKWQPIKYSVNYILDGGVNSSSNPSSYTIEDSITLKNPSKPGYTFKGWYSDSNYKTQVTNISNKTGNITLYAKFEVNSYNLTLDGNEGTFSPKVTFISDETVIKTAYLFEEDSITAYRPENKDGYIFAGWYKDENCSSLFKFNGTLKSDIALYAKWVECNSNTIDIEALDKLDVVISGKTEQLYAFVPIADGKIAVTSESDGLDLFGKLYDASKSVLISNDDISSTDLDFSYSYDVKAGQLYYIAVKGNTSLTSGDATINIKWTGECKLKGTTYPNRQISVEYDTNYNLPEKPIREGYIFLGWFDENDTKVTSGLWKFSTDKTLTAKWEQTTYHTVTFKNLEGEIISSETYYISEDIVAPELPVKAPDETYTYSAKWDNNYTGVCTGDAVYSPIFESTYIDYTVTFVDEDGKELSKKTYHWGDKIIEPDAPAKASDNIYSYTFGGWDKEVIDCAGDATYTATYTPKYIDYTVVFKDWDGAVISSETYHWGDEITEPDAPTRPDDENYIYNFVEWDKKVINCEGDETYTAIYDKTAIVVTTIVITSLPDKLVYLEDEDFDKTGMVVVAYYNNDTNEIITDYTISGYDNTVGTKAITVAYGDQTTTLTVEVTHNYVWIVDQENNCGVDGIKHEECSVCHAKQNEDTIIPATGEHIYSDAEDIECDVCKYLKAQIGDVDGDGNITIMDATMIQMHIAQLISIGEDRIVCADTDKDGTITIMDATMIQMFIAQLIPEL